LKTKDSETTHRAELSLFYLHSEDAKHFARLARCEARYENFHARHSILSVVFAAEALINKVLFRFSGLPEPVLENVERMSLEDKWVLAPAICGASGRAFDKSREPFQSFQELIRWRNELVHPKPRLFLDAFYREGEEITVIKMDGDAPHEQIPFVEILGDNSKLLPQTGIPLNPFQTVADDAEKALKLLMALEKELIALIGGSLTEKAIREVELRSVGDGKVTMISIESLFGGYSATKVKARVVTK
jgi:hypothetical protein